MGIIWFQCLYYLDDSSKNRLNSGYKKIYNNLCQILIICWLVGGGWKCTRSITNAIKVVLSKLGINRERRAKSYNWQFD